MDAGVLKCTRSIVLSRNDSMSSKTSVRTKPVSIYSVLCISSFYFRDKNIDWPFNFFNKITLQKSNLYRPETFQKTVPLSDFQIPVFFSYHATLELIYLF